MEWLESKTNDENFTPSSKIVNYTTTTVRDTAPNTTYYERPILGALSPNAPKSARRREKVTKHEREMGQSPLKRSFADSTYGSGEGDIGRGFTYLKSRRLSGWQRGDESQHAVSENRTLAFSIDNDESGIEKEQHVAPLLTDDSQRTEPNTPTSTSTRGCEPIREHIYTCDAPPGIQKDDSFSSLINYDLSSQPSQSTKSKPIFKDVSKAELLSLKLRVAMFKIRTDQTSVPFADLRTPETQAAIDKSTAVEAAVAELRAEARKKLQSERLRRERLRPSDSESQQGATMLLPAPVVLQPTNYNCRMIEFEMRGEKSASPDDLPIYLPSLRGAATTPLRHRDNAPGLRDQELTSSVVKSHVADGLLSLRNAA